MSLNQFTISLANRLVPLMYPFDQGKTTTLYRPSPDAAFKVRVNTFDKYILWETWKLGEYPLPALPSIPVIFDVGAHIGSFSVWAARKFPRARIFAFEPHPDNFRLLAENLRLNSLKQVTALNLAVSGRIGYVSLTPDSGNTGMHSLYPNAFPSPAGIKVKSLTLDSFLAARRLPRIDWLKLDVEGSEYGILTSLSPHVLKSVRAVSLEYHDYLPHGHSYPEIVSLLRRAGFAVRVKHYPFQRWLFKSGFIHAVKN